jgi:hypothetical protein
MEPPVSTKQRKPDYYYNTIKRLAKYNEDTKRIAYLQKELSSMGVNTTVTYSDMPHGSGTSDSTGDLSSKMADKNIELLQLQKDVELIDYAVGMLSQPKQLIIKVRFMTEYGQDKGARITLRSNARKYKWRMMSQGIYERLRDEAVGELAQILGENKTISM